MTEKDIIKISKAKIGDDVLLDNNALISVVPFKKIGSCKKCYFGEDGMDCSRISCFKKIFVLKSEHPEINEPKVDNTDWKQRKFELIKAVMNGIFSNGEIVNSLYSEEDKSEKLANFVCKYSDAVINKLKEDE